MKITKRENQNKSKTRFYCLSRSGSRKTGVFILLFLFLAGASFPADGGKKAPRKEVKKEASHHHCSNAEMGKAMEEIYSQNPVLRMKVENARHQSESDLVKFETMAKPAMATPYASTYTIPVVFHIMHARGSENVPDSKIEEAMEMLREDFRGLNSDLSEVVSQFQGIIGNVDIEFRLAQIDPDGYPTTGITRNYSDYTYNGTWDWPQIKTADFWPRDKYINVWVCLSSDGGYGSAWAYMPYQVDNGTGYENTDGVIISSWCLGYTTPGYYRILTHEIGHVLNLWHVWSPWLGAGDADACSEDDDVTDTPNCSGYYGGCDTSHTSCGSLDNIQNYMDYAQCPVMYSQGQVDRMYACLNSGVADRDQLWAASNLSQTLFSGTTPRIVYDHGEHANNLLMEDSVNNGGISSTLTINLVDVGSSEYFSVTSGAMTQGTHYTVSNVPAGLTPMVTGTGSTAATFTLTGTAANHADANDVSNLTLTFLDSAFTGGDASALYNPSDNHLRVDFMDPYAIVYSDIDDIACDSSATWTYFRVNDEGPYASDFGLWLYDGNMFKLETYGKSCICNSGTRNITAIAYGTTIDGSGNWQAPGSYPDQLDVSNSSYTDWNGKTRYVGFQFTIFGETHYGWMRVSVSSNGGTMTLLDYAYNPQPNAGIIAGSTEFPGGTEEVNADFTFSTTDLTVDFTDASTAVGTTITEWDWDFGDGNTSTQQNPSHTYAAAGTYTVTLSVSDGGPNSDSTPNSVTVSGPVVTITANFTFSTNELAVDFTDTSTAVNTTITNWQWNFGDGNSSTQQNPSHTYAAAGTYTVTLTASDDQSNSDLVSKPVAVSGPVVTITADFTFTTDDLTASFTDTSTAVNTSITNWLWDFGDGNTSTQQNPSHTYASDDTYTVSLTVSDSLSNSDSTSQAVTVLDDPPPAYCTATHIYNYGYIDNVTVGSIDNDSGWGTGGYADFTSQSTGMEIGTGYPVAVTCYNQHWDHNVIGIWVDWNQDGDFEDTSEEIYTVEAAGPYSTTITPPAHAASGATRMRVRLLYWKTAVPCGADNYFGDVEDYTINIGAGTPQPPNAAFSADATTVTVGGSVTFTDLSAQNPTAWSWTFEGGTPSTSTLQTPAVTYDTPGSYTVSLTVTNAQGSDTETKVDYITVTEVQYCTSSGDNQNYEWIAGVQAGSINNSSGASGYTDYTSMTANLAAGGSVGISLTPGFASGSYTEYWKIWIDYNGDGDFSDTGEEVFSGSGSSTVSGSFTVPASVSGTRRMRVTMQYDSPPSACGTFTYGEVEDYTVNIQ